MTSFQKLCTETSNELMNHIMPFWNKLKDERGGFYGYMDFDLNLDKDAEKGVILNSRIMWFYSNIYLTMKNAESLLYAKHAYDFLKEHCVDKTYGGVYWTLNADGSPCDDMKHTYNQAFAIYGLASYYDATGDNDALALAYELYQVVEEKCVDEYGYLEAFDRQWELIDNDKLSEDGYSASKTMNTLLHVIEAYTELYRVDKNKEIGAKLRKALEICKEKVYNPKDEMLDVFFDEKMNSIADIYSYGHDIEASWLIDRACKVLEDKDLTDEFSKLTMIIADHSIEAAFENGAMNNQYCRGEIDKRRVWWVQAEAIVGLINAYQKSGEQKYLDTAVEIWEYIKEHLIDKREGSEWFSNLDENGEPTSKEPIVEPWKCPYHNGRMCMEVLKRYADVH